MHLTYVEIMRLASDGYTFHIQNDNYIYHFVNSDISILHEVLYYEKKCFIIYDIDKIYKTVTGRLFKVDFVYSPNYKIK